jgi:hypothetical protein
MGTRGPGPTHTTCLRENLREEYCRGGRDISSLNHPGHQSARKTLGCLHTCPSWPQQLCALQLHFQLLQQQFQVGWNSFSPLRVKIIEQNQKVSARVNGVHPDLSLTLPVDPSQSRGFSTSTGTPTLDNSEPTSTLTPAHYLQQGTA